MTATSSGLLPAACSALVPGVGQLVNGEPGKALGVLVVATVAGASFLGAIPLLGSVAGVAYAATWLYSVADGFVRGRRRT